MAEARIDQVAAIKASLELMVAENAEIHEYFTDLLGKVAELEDESPEKRRERFTDLVSMGAFRFNGLDIRHFTQSQHKPLPPPMFLTRTKRRLKNTQTLLEEFSRRGIFEEAEQLRTELDLLGSNIVDENDSKSVRSFKSQVDDLRESTLFRSYLATKTAFIRKDVDLRKDAEMLAAKESVEEGEEIFRQRADDLDTLSQQLEGGALALDAAQAKLDEMTLPGKDSTDPMPGLEAGAESPPEPELDLPDEEEGEEETTP